MRPASIIWFERLFLGSLLIGAVQSVIGWEELMELGSPAYVLSIQLFVLAVMIALTLSVSRGRSRIAKWINVAVFALGLPVMISMLAGGTLAGADLLGIAQILMQGIGLGLLFTASARAWLGAKDVPESELRSTFD